MAVVVTALLEVEKSGKEFLYRTAASFVRTRTGLDHRTELLSKEELTSKNNHGGLFVIGSYVEKTSLQVEALFNKTDITAIEVHVDALLDPLRRQMRNSPGGRRDLDSTFGGQRYGNLHQQAIDYR